MYELTNAFIPHWNDTGAFETPATVDITCPHCGLSIVFELASWAFAESNGAASSTANCSSCGGEVAFFASQDQADAEDRKPRFFMHPKPDFVREPLKDISSVKEFDEALQRAYAASINVYNAREWTGTAVICRRTVEDIAKAVLPSDQHKLSLALQIEALPRRRDLARPILLLSDTLKRSGSLGAYFDLERTADKQTATLIIDLLEYLIQYLFILPERIEHLHEEVRSLSDPAAEKKRDRPRPYRT